MGLCWWQRVVALCIAEQVAPHGVGGAPDHEARAPIGTKDAKGSARAKSNTSSRLAKSCTSFLGVNVIRKSCSLEVFPQLSEVLPQLL